MLETARRQHNRTVMRALVGIRILLVYARLQGGVYGVGRDDDQDN